MKITLLQTDISWSSPEENIEKAERLIEEAGTADLFVLPEMWSTGFVTDAPGEDQQEALAWMWNTAKRKDAAVCGSLAVKLDNGQSVNRQFFVEPSGEISTYQIESIEELEPIRFPEEPENQETPDIQEDEDLDPDAGKSEQQVLDELTGQLRLFDDEEI